MSKIISTLSNMWLKVKNIENALLPELQASLGVLNSKEEKLIKILDFSGIEQFICDIQITIPKERIQIVAGTIRMSLQLNSLFYYLHAY